MSMTKGEHEDLERMKAKFYASTDTTKVFKRDADKIREKLAEERDPRRKLNRQRAWCMEHGYKNGKGNVVI